MLEIVRGRSWQQDFTVLDNEDGPLTDLTNGSIASQIREKDSVRNKTTGLYENALVLEVSVDVNTEDSIVTLSLTREQTDTLKLGVYMIDILWSTEGVDEPLLDPEPVAVNNRPTSP